MSGWVRAVRFGTVVLGVFGILAATFGSQPVVGAAAAGLAVGLHAGLIAAEAGLAARVALLRTGTAALGEGSTSVDTPRERLGALAPLADDLVQIAEALESARDDATSDKLTHVANRQSLLADLFDEIDRAARYGRALALLFVDIDHFKSVNDTYGHSVGDAVLRAVADTFRENVREQDAVGRYGGEEFVIVLPETTVDEAAAVAEKLRLLVLKQRVATGEGQELAVSVSIGVAGGQGTNLRVDDLLRDADNAMYSAKSLGRNQTYVFAEADDDTARIPRAPISADGRNRAAELGELGRQAAEAAIAAVVDPLPHYRGKPSSLIAAIAVAIGRRMELPDQEIERIRMAALLHDVGKVGVPEQILEKPGSLTPEEWQSVLQHPQIGQAIINQVAAIKDAGAIILHHHERYSGHGYPHGLRGGEIPLGARIVAIADAYDAMIHDRPYRKKITHEAAIAEMRRFAGLQFDPDLVQIFCALYEERAPVPDESLRASAPTPIGRRGAKRGSEATA